MRRDPINMAFIGLDLGTSGAKAVLFDERGRIIESSYKSYNVVYPKKGYKELNPEDVWEATKYTLIDISSRIRYKERVKALCTVSLGEAFIPIDNKGKVLYNSILATDVRGKEEIDILAKKIPREKIIEITGLPLSPNYSIPKILWLKNYRYDIYKKVWKFLFYQDFIVYKLCGETISDYSLSSRSMALDITKKTWSENILNIAGVSPDLFPSLNYAGTIIDNINSHVADELGLPHFLLVILGGHDQPCCALGAGAILEGYAVDSIGTSECITTLLPSRLQSEVTEKFNFATEPFIDKDKYNTIAYLHTAGALLKWLINIFSLEKENKGENPYVYFDKLCSELPSSLFVIPHFSGTGTPYMDTKAKGAIVGLTLDTKKEDIYKGFLEGIAFDLQNNIEYLERSGIILNKLFAVGGGSISREWLQIKANISRKEISTLECDEAGALGGAILAAKAVGTYDSLQTAVKFMVRLKDTFYPNEKISKIYIEKFKQYVKLYKNIESTNSFIAKLIS